MIVSCKVCHVMLSVKKEEIYKEHWEKYHEMFCPACRRNREFIVLQDDTKPLEALFG